MLIGCFTHLGDGGAVPLVFLLQRCLVVDQIQGCEVCIRCVYGMCVCIRGVFVYAMYVCVCDACVREKFS